MDGKISQANGRLRAGNVGVSIQQIGDRLYLRATLPPRPGSTRKDSYQQRIALGFRSNPAGIKAAESEARKVGVLLASGQFSWAAYLQESSQAETVSDWIARFEQHYLAAGGRPETWAGDYQKIFKKLEPGQALTGELLQGMILGTAPNTKTRRRACMAAGALAKFAGLEFDPAPLAGNYGPRRVAPRQLPTDEAIAAWRETIKNPAWRWVYGMLATYGLRPHEVFRLDLEEFARSGPIVTVLENTKTGARRVWPCYPDWWNAWSLGDVQLPGVDLSRSNDKIGHSVSKYFLETKCPFKPYDLRHCWAVRSLEFGLDISLAAQQMGHSVQVHSQQYHHWITDRHHQRAFEALMLRSDRPRPPELPCIESSHSGNQPPG